MKCIRCNGDIDETSIFCPHCGAQIHSNDGSFNSSENLTGESKKRITKGLTKTRIVMLILGMCVFVVLELIIIKWAIPFAKYNKAQRLMKEQNYDEAYSILSGLNNFHHASEVIKQSQFERAVELCKIGKYEEGYAIFRELGDFNNADGEILKSKYSRAITLIDEEKYDSAYDLLKEIAPYNDAEKLMKNNIVERAMRLKKEKEYDEAYSLFKSIRGYLYNNGELVVNVDDEIVDVYFLSVSATLTKCYEKGREGPALKYLRTAISNSDAGKALQDLYSNKEKEFKDAALKKAQALFKKADYEGAIKTLKSAQTYLSPNDSIAEKIQEYENSIPSIPAGLQKYADGLVFVGKNYRVDLDEDDWFINYRSEPVYISISQQKNNIVGKLRHGTEIMVEFIYNDTWVVFQMDGEYVFSSLYSENNPNKDSLFKEVS